MLVPDKASGYYDRNRVLIPLFLRVSAIAEELLFIVTGLREMAIIALLKYLQLVMTCV